VQQGFTLHMPDCRAYVQVSPGAGGKNENSAEGKPGVEQSSPDGKRVHYYSTGPFSGAPSTEVGFPMYVSSSEGGVGWGTQPVLVFNAPAERAVGFDQALSQAVVWVEGATLVEEAPGVGREFVEAPSAGGSGFYLHEMATGIYRLLFHALATNSDRGVFSLAGFSANGRSVVFESGEDLASGAVAGAPNVYESDTEKPAGEQLSLVGLLADGNAPEGGSIAGAGAGANEFQEPHYSQSAVSESGQRVFFTAEPSGRIYARVDGDQTIAISAGTAEFREATPEGRYVFYTEDEQLYRYDLGSEGEPPREAPPLALSEGAAGVLGTLAVSSDGSYAYFAATGVLAANSRVTSASGTGTLTSGSVQVSALVNAPTGGFFAAGQEISGQGIPAHTTITAVSASTLTLSNAATESAVAVALSATSEEKAASAEEVANLYEWHQQGEGPPTTTFIARLSNEKSVFGDEGDWRDELLRSGIELAERSSRVSPDGHTLLFSSRLALTGYTNSGPCFSRACQELFRYQTVEGGVPASLTCVSCGPLGSQPQAETILSGVAAKGASPPNEAVLSRNLSEDGRRVFFQTANPLLSQVRTGAINVYEWEAKGEGTCTIETLDQGCLYLISTGTSGEESYFADASANGDQVFFFTDQQLASSDTDNNVDLYDACSGCAPPPPEECKDGTVLNQATEKCEVKPCFGETECRECHGEPECREPTNTPPAETHPATAALTGSGNLIQPVQPPEQQVVVKPKPKTKPARCRKGEVRKHGKCMKRKAAKSSAKNTSNNRRSKS
jgi:hypothetical protein